MEREQVRAEALSIMPEETRTAVNRLETTDELVFREGRAADQGTIRRILAEAGFLFHDYIEKGSTPGNMIGSIHVHLLERNEEVLGVLLWRDLGEEVEVLDMVVALRHRRKGFGLHLLRRLVALVREGGARVLFLEVRESNAAALALYRKAGFSETGRRLGYYRQPEEAALLLSLESPG